MRAVAFASLLAAASFAAPAAARLSILLTPANCTSPGGDCAPAFRDAARLCAVHGPSCDIVLAPGRYRATCPAYAGPFAYVRTPGAVDLSNLSDVSFGALDPSAPARLDADYLGAGCPAVAAARASNVSLRNLVLDTVRLPFTEGAVLDAPGGGRAVRIRLFDPAHGAFDVGAYPWLRDGWDWFGYVGPNLAGFTGGAWDARLGVATLTYAAPDASRAAIAPGTHVLCKHFLNMQAWGVYGLAVKGTFLLEDVTLLSSGGMGLRCDFCEGEWVGRRTSVVAAPNRSLSTTADGVHFMHHKGSITLVDSKISETGDDCFNAHGNFIALMDVGVAGDPRRATYVDETGPGWLPEAAALMAGDAVQFFSRLSLQPVGAPTALVSATGGFGTNATLLFRDPIPAEVRPYDMFLSLDRRPRLVAEGNAFFAGGGGTQNSRGMVVSAVGARIVGNLFRGLNATSILFMTGGCGAYIDYTEGPFSEDVIIANNTFEASPVHQAGRLSGGMAVVQATGCVPSSCAAAPPAPPPEPYPMPPCASGGSSQPPIVPHVGDTDGPGRIQEGGSALLVARAKLFRNLTISGNHFTSSSRFVDIGVADGVVMEGNTLVAMRGSPSDGAICIYGSTGFNSTVIAERNVCLNGSTPVACSFCAPTT
jgi:hypothetical protein